MVLPVIARLGAPLPGAVEARALTTAIHTQPISRRTRQRIVVILGGVLAVWAFLVVARWHYSAPERTVDRYFDALLDRDFGAAMAQFADRPQSPLLAPFILRDPGYSPPIDVRIEEIVGGEEKTATVSVRLGDTRHTAKLALTKADTVTFWLYHPWRITTVDTLDLDSGTSDVTVAGVPLHGTDSGLSVPALIGQYKVHVPADPLFEDPSAAVYVGTGDTWTVRLSVKDSAEGEIRRRIHAWLADWARSEEPQPTGCPFQSTYSYTTGKWALDEDPMISVQPESGEVRVATVQQGQATFTEVYSDGSEGEPEQVSFSVSGTVAVIDGEVNWNPEG